MLKINCQKGIILIYLLCVIKCGSPAINNKGPTELPVPSSTTSVCHLHTNKPSDPNCQRQRNKVFEPLGPMVKCSYLSSDFIKCDEPIDHKGNKTAKEELGYGCVKFGGQRYEDVEKTKVRCEALQQIECHGNRTFLRDGVPCIRYTGHYFATTLLYSILLGFLGMDRFCLGHTGTAVGKLLTVGGVGVWWVVDVVLLCVGGLSPEDGSNWMPYV